MEPEERSHPYIDREMDRLLASSYRQVLEGLGRPVQVKNLSMAR